jgi:hypothetical protein
MNSKKSKRSVMSRLRGRSATKKTGSSNKKNSGSYPMKDKHDMPRTVSLENDQKLNLQFREDQIHHIATTKHADLKSLSSGIPCYLPRPKEQREGGKRGARSFKGGILSWLKNKNSDNEPSKTASRSHESGGGGIKVDPTFTSYGATMGVQNLTSIPSENDTSPSDVDSGTSTDSSNSGLAFPVPDEDGQEIAIQDNEHCYEDPAHVHSMLTMPSFSGHLRRNDDDDDDFEMESPDEEQDDDDDTDCEEDGVIPATGDGSLLTDDAAALLHLVQKRNKQQEEEQRQKKKDSSQQTAAGIQHQEFQATKHHDEVGEEVVINQDKELSLIEYAEKALATVVIDAIDMQSC